MSIGTHVEKRAPAEPWALAWDVPGAFEVSVFKDGAAEFTARIWVSTGDKPLFKATGTTPRLAMAAALNAALEHT